MFDETPTKAHMLVNAVLNHLCDRRPFKHALPDMESNHPDLWEEMLEEMRDSAQLVLDTGDYRGVVRGSNEPATDIEKMVWASTFALEHRANQKSIPTHDTEDPIWKDRCAMFAMQAAYSTVLSLRKMLNRFQAPGDPEDASEPHEMVKFLVSLGFSKEDDSRT